MGQGGHVRINVEYVSLLFRDSKNGGPSEYSVTSYNSVCAYMPARALFAVEDVQGKLAMPWLLRHS